MAASLRLRNGLPWGVAPAALVLVFGPVGYLVLVAGTRYPVAFVVLFVVGGLSYLKILVQDRRDSRVNRRRSLAGWHLLVAAVLWVVPAWYVALRWAFGSDDEPAGCNRDLFMACASPAEGALFMADFLYPFVFLAGWVLMEILHALRPRVSAP